MSRKRKKRKSKNNKKWIIIRIMLWIRKKRVGMGVSLLLINRKKEIIKRIKVRQRPKIKRKLNKNNYRCKNN